LFHVAQSQSDTVGIHSSRLQSFDRQGVVSLWLVVLLAVL
jgi:hypothetical protein